MHKKTVIGVLLLVAIFSTFSIVSASDISTVKVSDSEIAAGSSFGAGSSYPLMTPMDTGYVHVSTKEPVKIIWTIYDPSFHEVTKIEHTPSTKYQDGGEWLFADKTTFVLPAFAAKGSWAASCKVIFSDDTSQDISWDGYIYQGIPCGDSGDVLSNIFVYPWYMFGWMIPSMFWFPGVLLWFPLAWYGLAIMFNRFFPDFMESVRSVIGTARKSVGGNRKRKKKSS